jgi:hypothetical protein
MQRYRDAVLDQFGNAVVGAEVAVLDAQGNLATLYSDNGTAALTNPTKTDANGSFAFYAANGRYTLRITGTGLPTREVSDVLLQDPGQLLTAGDVLNDFVASGLLPAVPNPVSLSATTPAGVAYVLGTRVAPPATAKAYTASKDTYVDLSDKGVYTYSEVANGAAMPATAASSIRIFKVVTNATEITGVTRLFTPILLKIPALIPPPSYTVATLPSTALYARCTIYVSDEAGGAVLAFSDGTNWRRVTDRAVVS